MSKVTRTALALALGVTLLGQGARAGVLFDPTGTGSAANASSVSIIDPTGGSALALNVISGGGLTGDVFQLIYQAVLNPGGFENANGDSINLPAGSATQFTMVAGFYEQAGAAGPLSANFTTVAPPAGQPASYVRIYAGTSANTLAGTGFNSGTLIYEGTVNPGGTGSYNVTDPVPSPLDQFGGNNYGAIRTVTGNGSTSLSAVTTFQDNSYFLSPIVGLNLNFTTTNKTPFDASNPSALVYNGFTNTNVPGATLASVGPINGVSGPNFIFQADAIAAITAVPEPSTIISAAMAFGLLGLGLARRKTRTVVA